MCVSKKKLKSMHAGSSFFFLQKILSAPPFQLKRINTRILFYISFHNYLIYMTNYFCHYLLLLKHVKFLHINIHCKFCVKMWRLIPLVSRIFNICKDLVINQHLCTHAVIQYVLVSWQKPFHCMIFYLSPSYLIIWQIFNINPPRNQ